MLVWAGVSRAGDTSAFELLNFYCVLCVKLGNMRNTFSLLKLWDRSLFPLLLESTCPVLGIRVIIYSIRMTVFSCRERTAEGQERRAAHCGWRLGAKPRGRRGRTLPAAVSIENRLSGATGPHQLPILALASFGQVSRESRAQVPGTLPTVLEVYQVST